jgi:hypothetical protein
MPVPKSIVATSLYGKQKQPMHFVCKLSTDSWASEPKFKHPRLSMIDDRLLLLLGQPLCLHLPR